MSGPADPAAAGLTLSLTQTTTDPGGRLVQVTVRLSNDGDQTRQVFYDPVVVELLDQAGSAVTEPGWRQPGAREVVLQPGDWLELTGEVELRGPRGGSRSPPLRAGRYDVRASLSNSVQDGDGSTATGTLTSALSRLEVPLAP